MLCCIEKGDDEILVGRVVDRVKQINAFINRNEVVLLPFAHLSRNLESVDRSIVMLNKIGVALEDAGFDSSLLSFGTHKDISLDSAGHNGSASYFEFY